MSHLRPRITTALTAVAAALDVAGVEWLLTGGAARALSGWRHDPGDIDIEISPHSVEAGAAALGLTLRDESDRSARSLRAAGMVCEVAVDLTCDLEVEGAGGRLSPDFPLQRTFATSVELGGRRLWIAPIEEAVARAMVRSDWGSLARLAAEAPRDGEIRAAYLSLRLAAAVRAAR